MIFKYPKHFTHPKDEPCFFMGNIETWDNFFSEIKNKPNVSLEIGALYGGSSVYILEEFCRLEGSHHYIMDINTNEYLENNLKPYENKVTFMKGESADMFKKLEHNGLSKEFLDLIYIDGNHMSKYVLEDAVNSFYYLKNDGYIIFDDYLGGLEQEKHMQVKTGVDAFYHAYEKYVDAVYNGYQVIMKKKSYENINELKANYYK